MDEQMPLGYQKNNVESTRKQMQSTENIMQPWQENRNQETLRKYPPMIKPERYPDEIMYGFLDKSEIETIRKHLLTFQKSSIGWDDYRSKIDPSLLKKWAKVLLNCRQNGFLYPHATPIDIVWQQILSRETEKDRCVVCPNSLANSTCEGKIQGERFIRCYET